MYVRTYLRTYIRTYIHTYIMFLSGLQDASSVLKPTYQKQPISNEPKPTTQGTYIIMFTILVYV